MTYGKILITLASACALSLTACSVESEEEAAESDAVSSETVSSLIASADDLERVSDLLNDSGLADAFDGTAPYTIFAPIDEALDALGEDFTGEEARPAVLAILRDHIVPGYLTREDIVAAIEANGGPVEMQSMGEGMITLSADGDTISVSTSGSEMTATLGSSMQGVNGVVYPVDTVLKDLEPAS